MPHNPSVLVGPTALHVTHPVEVGVARPVRADPAARGCRPWHVTFRPGNPGPDTAGPGAAP
jgi:hypothetical protein